jgi:phosphoribosylcarboxyaminoimidazole (NCAIR) mutase
VKLARIGLVVNVRAGVGGERNRTVAAAVLRALGECHVVAGTVDTSDHSDPATTARVAREAVQRQADALVVIGGDGTMADAANALFASGSHLPILGVGAGSTNAGALVSLHHSRASDLAGAALAVHSVAALEVLAPDGSTTLAFNDVIVGTTVCGTSAGRFVNLAAEPFMRGERVEERPHVLESPAAEVSKVTSSGAIVRVAAGADVASVAVGFTRTGDVQGQALLAGLGLSSGAGVPAACLVASFPVVFAGLERADHAAFEPLRSWYVGLSEGERIILTGLGEGAVLCADGNPLRVLRPVDRVEVRVVADACSVVHVAGGVS